ncbi:methyltransferase [Cereibacter changlensis]|uniref:methyltransferase n=1 Tax=Cereibacter changlensis TaxID=402884 RepID=UPI004033D237
MTAVPATNRPARGLPKLARLGLRLAGSPRVQALAARTPGLRWLVRREGEAIFDLVAGFVHSQILLALVELKVMPALREGPQSVTALAARCAVPVERMQLLLQGGAALKLLKRRRDGRFDLATRGAAFLAVPGLEAMVGHHDVLYRDLADPVAFFRGEVETELSGFWPYVFGAAGASDPAVTAQYSGLMADSQSLVAADTLRLVDFQGVKHLMDVGGGTGAFLAAVGRAHPLIRLSLFDLPAVVEAAPERLAKAGLMQRVEIHGGSFRDDPLPQGADAISLIRILFDHQDATVAALLAKVFAALPPGGRIIIAEPMSGGARPDRETDTYFALYTAAMRTGRTRSAAEISALLSKAGFAEIRPRPGFRPYVTSAITAVRPLVASDPTGSANPTQAETV